VAELIDCTPIVVESPDSVHEGCAILTKRRHFVITKGQCGTAQWTLRHSDGQVADLSDCFPEGSSSSSSSESGDLAIKVRYQGCDGGNVIATVSASVEDAATGTVQFEIPETVCCNAGIYVFQVAILQDDKKVVFHDGGLVSVEQGLWGDTNSMGGPPTLQTIRIAMRDTAIENDLLRDVEFDDAEILEAIRQPVLYFNEIPPPLTHFRCNNFPYRHHWRQAIIAELMKIGAQHYIRNAMKASSGGLQVDDKNKYSEYLQVAQMYAQEWKEFVANTKVQLNAGGFSGTYGSAYEY